MSEQLDTLEVLLQHYGWQSLSAQLELPETEASADEDASDYDNFERRAS